MKKIIALLLSIIMVFCSLPISVFSETLESQPIEENTEENTASPFCEYCKPLMKEHTSSINFQ